MYSIWAFEISSNGIDICKSWTDINGGETIDITRYEIFQSFTELLIVNNLEKPISFSFLVNLFKINLLSR
jgi:hypothetical protein